MSAAELAVKHMEKEGNLWRFFPWPDCRYEIEFTFVTTLLLCGKWALYAELAVKHMEKEGNLWRFFPWPDCRYEIEFTFVTTLLLCGKWALYFIYVYNAHS